MRTNVQGRATHYCTSFGHKPLSSRRLIDSVANLAHTSYLNAKFDALSAFSIPSTFHFAAYNLRDVVHIRGVAETRFPRFPESEKC
jgi:hypothetical protein